MKVAGFMACSDGFSPSTGLESGMEVQNVSYLPLKGHVMQLKIE